MSEDNRGEFCPECKQIRLRIDHHLYCVGWSHCPYKGTGDWGTDRPAPEKRFLSDSSAEPDPRADKYDGYDACPYCGGTEFKAGAQVASNPKTGDRGPAAKEPTVAELERQPSLRVSEDAMGLIRRLYDAGESLTLDDNELTPEQYSKAMKALGEARELLRLSSE